MMKNEITYKGIKIIKCRERNHHGAFFSYTVARRVITETETRFLSIRETSLDRIKDSINSELSRGTSVVDGILIHTTSK